MVVFRKVLTAERAEAEIRGWHAVEGHLPVPALIGRITMADGHAVDFEDVFASGRCQELLGDLVADADTDPTRVPAVRRLVNEICTDWCRAVELTGKVADFAACVPALYSDRLRPGGRLDRWYHETQRLAGLDISTLLADLRAELRPDRPWLTALTQGDPTEANIGHPRCWLDFEHAGRNTIAGEIANLLWYLLALGGWLVPRYQPEVYARTMRRPALPRRTPVLAHAESSAQQGIERASYTWHLGPGRRAAVEQLLLRIQHDLGEAINLDRDRPMRCLGPFLALRILGVLPIGGMERQDAVLLATKLAETRTDDFPLADFCGITTLCQEPR